MTGAEDAARRRPPPAARSAAPTPGDAWPRQAARVTMSALHDNDDVFATFFDCAQIGLALVDLLGCYVRVNAQYAALLGRPAEELVGVPLAEVLDPDDATAPVVPGLLAGEQSTSQSERAYTARDGRTSWVLHAVATVADGDGRPAWFAVSAQDITERHRVEQELRELTALLTERAVRDPLTGLANRGLLEERLRTALARDARSGQSSGVLFLDLDGFKAINDAHGHAVGDAVLRTVGQRLTTAVRPSDTVARLGGDEFVVLVEDTGSDSLKRLAQRLRDAVAAAMTIGALEVTVGVSVGAALAVRGAGAVGDLLAAADLRMYQHKRRGRDTPTGG